MNQEELMDRLRNPKKYQKQVQKPQTAEEVKAAQQTVAAKQQSSRMLKLVGGATFGLVLVSLLFILSSQNRAENVSRALDPNVLKGLVVDQTFTPQTGRKVIHISEGAERNIVATGLYASSTLPVISRYNFRSLTDKNFEVIGAAPWALTLNVKENVQDPELLRYLFNQQLVINNFLARADVDPLLKDSKALAEAAANEKALATFFAQEEVKNVLDSEKALLALTGSRLFSYLLVSKAAKYYRDNPVEAVKLIQASPTLSALKQNPNVRKAVQENTYLKNIAPTLLK